MLCQTSITAICSPAWASLFLTWSEMERCLMMVSKLEGLGSQRGNRRQTTSDRRNPGLINPLCPQSFLGKVQQYISHHNRVIHRRGSLGKRNGCLANSTSKEGKNEPLFLLGVRQHRLITLYWQEDIYSLFKPDLFPTRCQEALT